MSDRIDSVYPDFLRTGLGKLSQLDARSELLALFSALEHFRRDLHAQDTSAGIVRVSHDYVAGLNLFRATGFWLVNPSDFSFEPVHAKPDDQRDPLQRAVDANIRSGRFAVALRQTAPVFFQHAAPAAPERGVLHALALSSQTVGMFCGLLHREPAPAQEVAFSLLSLLLGESADALATLRKTKQLTTEIQTLSEMLPLCAWCKKVRNDRGYWEQIEKYIATRSGTAITHGICPDCQRKVIEGLDKV